MIQVAHIGYPKCGSTWLQKYIFPNHNDIFLLGRAAGDKIIDDDIRLFLWSQLIDSNEFYYKKKHFSNLIDRYVEKASLKSCRTICLSSELITNSLIGRVDLSQRAIRLHDFMPHAKIIMIVREQISWLNSSYGMLVKELGATFSIHDYAKWIISEPDISPLTSLYYDWMYDHYADLFGASNIHVVPYELLSNDPTSFANTIQDILEVDHFPVQLEKANAGPDISTLNDLLKMNRAHPFRFGRETIITRPFGFEAGPIFTMNGVAVPDKYIEQTERYKKNWNYKSENVHPERHSLDESSNKQLRDIYAPHNANLQSKTGLNLSPYAYSGT